MQTRSTRYQQSRLCTAVGEDPRNFHIQGGQAL